MSLPVIISASRRTDIPRLYARWFSRRRKEGQAEFRNSFGVKGSVSLRDDDVLGFLFWTRYARPFAGELRSLLAAGLPCVFQYTITGYGRELEPHAPLTAGAVADFRATSGLLPGPACIQWRYDPIVISEAQPAGWHLENFERLAAALQGATRVVNTSFVEPYAKAIRRMQNPTAFFRRVDAKRHKTVAARHPDLLLIDDAGGRSFLAKLGAIARRYAMELRTCANPEWGLPESQCCGSELFAPYGEEVLKKIAALPSAPTRAACRCLKSVDIGMDNTCPGGCKYCYVVSSQATALKNFRIHRPYGATLR